MQSSARAELRQFPRRCVGRSQLLTVDVVRETGSTQHGIVLNISEGGAALQLLGTPQGAGVSRMRLNFPAHDSPLESGAKLAWLAPGGRAGVQFSNLPPRTRDAIREWLRAQPVHELETSPDVGAVVANDLDEFGLTLGIIAERAMARTGAKGAAIAIGNRDFMVCCASIGNAPALHAPLRPDSGLSGICLRSGTDLYCLDAKSDGRIDPAVADQLGMRSAALLPVTVSGDVVGILELFSDEPNQFGPATTRDRLGRLLQFLASAIAEYQPTDEANESVVENVVAAEVSPTVEPSASVEPPPIPAAEAPMQEEASDTDIRKLLDIATPQQTGGVPRTVIIVFVLLAVAAAGFWYFMQQSSAPANTLPSETTAAPADAVPPLVGLSPSAVTAKAGDPFSVDVVMSNAQNISSIGLQIIHDPNTIKVVGISAGDLLGPSGTIVHREQAGQLQVSASVPPTSAAISGSGIVCTVYLLAKSPGKSTLTVNQLSLKDSAMRPASAQSSDATVTITR